MSKILVAEDVYTPVPGRPPAAWAPLLGLRNSRTIATPPDDAKMAKAKVTAFVNDGRWVVVCRCGGAEITSPDDPLFWCWECRPSEWSPVIWPDAKTRAEAEELLTARPEMRTRNWRPWEETVADLVAENTARLGR